MWKIKPILRFLLWFTMTYIGLLFLATAFKDQYAHYYQAIGKARFEQFGQKGIVQFFSYEDKITSYKLDTKVVLFNRDQVVAAKQSGQATVKGADLFISSWYSALLPTILLLTLILASPVSLKRKLLAIVLGLLIMYLFIVFKLRLSIANEYLKNPWLEFPLSHPKWTKTAHDIFVTNIETTIIFPVFIWILVTFRKSDLETISSHS